MTEANLKELILLVTPSRFGDQRGFFAEAYSRRRYAEMGIDVEFVQDSHSLSWNGPTLRGLHFQAPPHAQDILIRGGCGEIFYVAVDAGRGSPTYGQCVGSKLSAENGHQLYVSIGFKHGFVTFEPDSEIIYKRINYYAPENEGALRWDDPGIGIKLPLKGNTIPNEKDAISPVLNDFESLIIYCENS